ncbi:MAG: Nif3-like dinuclear metal center hexameric protein [Candidatus Brocadiia bacterium]
MNFVFIMRPTPFSELIEQVKKKTSMASLRVGDAGIPNKLVKRIGLPWGGLGLFTNVGYQQRLIEAGCDAFIAGESDNLGLRFATECGIPIIETSHEISENPGLEHFATILSEAFPALDVSFFNVECVWEMA